MMELQAWLAGYRAAVRAAFGARIVCIGLQGSQGRGEARPDSDIDVVLILDHAAPDDLLRYRALVAHLPMRDKLCGFVSGADVLACWDRAELVSFYYDTIPLEGSLDFLLPQLGPQAAARSVHTGACAIYHACAHNLVHAQSAACVDELQKAAFFVLRAQHFCEHGTFPRSRLALLPHLSPQTRAVLEPGTLEARSARLLAWAQGLIAQYASTDTDERSADKLGGRRTPDVR